MPVVTYQVSVGGDDGYIYSSGSFDNSTVAIYAGAASNPRSLFARFTGVEVPNGATIVSAKLQYKANASRSTETCATQIFFNDTDDAVSPANYAEYTGKALTSPVDWVMPAFVSGAWCDSPDLKNLVQAVVNRAGWLPGNAMMVLHKDNGSGYNAYRPICAYETTGNLDGPKLVIEYTMGGTDVTVTAAVGEASAEALASIPHADVLVVGGVGEASAEALAANPTTALIVLGAVAEAVAEALPAAPHADVLVQAEVAESAAEALPATALYNIHVTVLAATAEASAEALPAEPLAQRNITVEAAIGTATAEALAAIVRAGKKLYWVIKYQ
jgi:hypothetical protein